MANLKAGTVTNLQTDTLAGAMDREFVSLWNVRKDIALPNDQEAIDDRRMMFVAIARGMLGYLHNHLSNVGTTTDQAGSVGTDHDHQLEFEWE
jgi:hypothetical protein